VTFDQNGPANFTDLLDEYEENYFNLTVVAGARVDLELVDTTARTGYGMIGVQPKTPHEMAVEYYIWDWEDAQTPEGAQFLYAWLIRHDSRSDRSNHRSNHRGSPRLGSVLVIVLVVYPD